MFRVMVGVPEITACLLHRSSRRPGPLRSWTVWRIRDVRRKAKRASGVRYRISFPEFTPWFVDLTDLPQLIENPSGYGISGGYDRISISFSNPSRVVRPFIL